MLLLSKRSDMNKPYYVIYTDGSCYKGTGGYGVYIQYRTKEKVLKETELSCGFENTTISRMELMAIIVGLMTIEEKQSISILIVSDSQYIINSIRNQWLDRWEREDFVGRLNSDLWKVFLEEWRQFNCEKIKFRHTRGHEKGLDCYKEGNSHADILASYKNFIGNYEKDFSDEEWKLMNKDSLDPNLVKEDLPF